MEKFFLETDFKKVLYLKKKIPLNAKPRSKDGTHYFLSHIKILCNFKQFVS